MLDAPTGAGKTLAGFLPALLDINEKRVSSDAISTGSGLHTLYISPLKSLTVDVHRNLTIPLQETGLDIRVETRSGDTPQAKKQRQKINPPDMLMTTPESLALLTSYEEAAFFFASLRFIILDEIHSLIPSKRGDLLSLNLARLEKLAPNAVRIGLSATLREPEAAACYIGRGRKAITVRVPERTAPDIEIIVPETRMPWAGRDATYASKCLYQHIEKARMSVVFVNTRAQAERLFQALWDVNRANKRIAIHHASMAQPLRCKVESRMAAGVLDCVVATSSLELGLDWADIDLVVQIGAPKGVSRLLQRIGRSNHRLKEISKAILVPTNRFEYLECLAALDAVNARDLDPLPIRKGGLDVLAQHITGTACCAPFKSDDLYREVIKAEPYKDLPRADFDHVLAFVENGGYALKAYDRYARLVARNGLYRLAHSRFRLQYRMNIGTIIESHSLKVKLGSKTLGNVEESFIAGLSPGDSFAFAGRVVRYDRISPEGVRVSKASGTVPRIPTYAGGRLSLSAPLAARVRRYLASPDSWSLMPEQISSWLYQQRLVSALPSSAGMLVETFKRQQNKIPYHYMVAYPFEGRNAHQTLGFLLLKRLERIGKKPLGFVATDYGIALWALHPVGQITDLFDKNIIHDDLPQWLAETPLLKKSFRDAAVIAGLIERRHTGHLKTGKQVTFSADLIYDVLNKYEPGHILLKATRQDAYGGLIDLDRLGDMLARIEGNITHQQLERVSPLALPLILEISRETIDKSKMVEMTFEMLEEKLMKEAGLA